MFHLHSKNVRWFNMCKMLNQWLHVIVSGGIPHAFPHLHIGPSDMKLLKSLSSKPRKASNRARVKSWPPSSQRWDSKCSLAQDVFLHHLASMCTTGIPRITVSKPWQNHAELWDSPHQQNQLLQAFTINSITTHSWPHGALITAKAQVSIVESLGIHGNPGRLWHHSLPLNPQLVNVMITLVIHKLQLVSHPPKKNHIGG